MDEPTKRSATFGAQTAARAFVVLQVIVDSRPPLTLAELSAKVGLNKSITYRLTREMEEQGLITTNGDRAYVPASGLFSLAARVLGRLDLRQIARPYLLQASELTGETIALHLRAGKNRVCVDIVEGIYPVRRFMALGETLPLFVGPSGKTILAFLSESEAAPSLAAAARAGVDLSVLQRTLEDIRKHRYMAAVGDQNAGVGGLSVPVFGIGGVVAVITLSGPSDRWNENAMQAAAPAIVDLAQRCSTALGGVDFPAAGEEPVATHANGVVHGGV